MPTMTPLERQQRRFPGAYGRLSGKVAGQHLPLWRSQQTEALIYAIPWKCAPYWIVFGPDAWAIMSTLQFRSEYEPANQVAQETWSRHVRKHRKRRGFYAQRRGNVNAI